MFKIFRKNCCGLDVHKTWIYACIGITDHWEFSFIYIKGMSEYAKGWRDAN